MEVTMGPEPRHPRLKKYPYDWDGNWDAGGNYSEAEQEELAKEYLAWVRWARNGREGYMPTVPQDG